MLVAERWWPPKSGVTAFSFDSIAVSTWLGANARALGACLGCSDFRLTDRSEKGFLSAMDFRFLCPLFLFSPYDDFLSLLVYAFSLYFRFLS